MMCYLLRQQMHPIVVIHPYNFNYSTICWWHSLTIYVALHAISFLGPFPSKIVPYDSPLSELPPWCFLLLQARSPNFSSVGHIWDIIGRQIRWPKMSKIWSNNSRNVSQNEIRNLYHSLPKRIETYIAAK